MRQILTVWIVAAFVFFGAGALLAGTINPTRTGNAQQVNVGASVSVIGGATALHCVHFDDNTGNLSDAGSACLTVSSPALVTPTTTNATTAGSAPAVATGVGDCGTSPSVAGNDNAGRVTVGSSTNGGHCTLTFAATWAKAPACVCNDDTTAVACRAAGTSTTTTVLTGVFVAGDKIAFVCTAYN